MEGMNTQTCKCGHYKSNHNKGCLFCDCKDFKSEGIYTIDGLNWSTELPTQNGVYWVYAKHWGGDMVVETADVSIINNGAINLSWPVGGYECEPDFNVKDVTHWLGPLPEPELPEVG
jgi:hypothetical protein